MKKLPLAYLLTFCCYGHRLHGAEDGSVTVFQNEFGTPFVTPSEDLQRSERLRMKQPPYMLDIVRAGHVLSAVQSTCAYHNWCLLAFHARRTHVHSVVQGNSEPEAMLDEFKEYSSRRLNEAGLDWQGRRRWAERRGSTRYLWEIDRVCQALEYVLYEQGRPFVTFRNDTHPYVRRLEDVRQQAKHRATSRKGVVG